MTYPDVFFQTPFCGAFTCDFRQCQGVPFESMAGMTTAFKNINDNFKTRLLVYKQCPMFGDFCLRAQRRCCNSTWPRCFEDPPLTQSRPSQQNCYGPQGTWEKNSQFNHHGSEQNCTKACSWDNVPNDGQQSSMMNEKHVQKNPELIIPSLRWTTWAPTTLHMEISFMKIARLLS